MDNDEKTAPIGDEKGPSTGHEPLQVRTDAAEAAPKDGEPVVMWSANTLPFPGPRSEPLPPGLDDSFGMPDFGFFSESPVTQAKRVPGAPPAPTLSAAQAKRAPAAPAVQAAPTTSDAPEPVASPMEFAEPTVFTEPMAFTEPVAFAEPVAEAPIADAPSADATADSTKAPVLPLQDGTGWDTVGNIMKSSSLRARIEAQDADVDEIVLDMDDEAVIQQLFANDDETPDVAEIEKPAVPRHDANVTPFPGTVVRHAERAPSDILRGTGKSADVFDDISARATDGEEAPMAEVSANPDALADAVQSALRNIYGSYPEHGEERPDMSGFTVADALAGADNQPDEAVWPEERALSADWQGGARSRDYDAPATEAEGASSEAVLDYFYTQQRRQERPAPQISPEMSLSDYAARAQQEEKWPEEDEPEEEPQRVMPFPPRDRSQTYRDRAQNYSARAPELSTAGEQPIGRGAFFRDDAVRPAIETEWGQPAYNAPPQNARGSISPTYAPAVTTSADPLPTPQGPDSNHLLGAAGLGLIGGIALAGVLAVFVFNNFVDESGRDGGTKVVERLAPPQTAANTLDIRSSADSRPADNRLGDNRSAQAPISTQAPVSTQSAPPSGLDQFATEPQRQAALSIPTQPLPDPVKPKLSAVPVAGAPDSPIRLNITLGDVETGDTLISLKGLPKDARLSTGIDVGGGQWLLPPGRLKDLTVSAPASAAGNYPLEAQLLKDDAQTSISDAVPFVLSIGAPSRPASGQAAPSVAPAQQKAEAPSRLALLPDEAPLPETDFLTQMLIRDGNKKMREGDIAGARRLYEQATVSGNAEAALAMGRSYDPTYFEKLNVKTGKPDPATAFEWYKKALDGGLVTAKVKIDALKQWLQR